LTIYTEAMVFVMVFQSLNLLVRTSGQVSLCQAGFVAVGAAAFSHLAVGAGVPWLLALLLAGLIAAPVGAIVAIPAIRLSGLFLALATLGFGLCLAQLFYPASYMFGVSGSLATPRPGGLASDKEFYYVCAGFALASCLLIAAIDRSRLGRLLRAMADSPTSLATLGLTVNITLVAVFCVSAFIAAVAGGLYGGVVSQVSGIPFNPLTSLTWLAVLGLSGRGRQSAAVIAAGLLEVVPAYINSATITSYLPVAFGAGAVIAALVESTRRGRDGAAADRVSPTPSSRWTARLRGRDPLLAGRAPLALTGGRP
jgi:ABC-type branched-subunit amino acid transport system permease subunit